ncbi:hypothetical protein F5X97DRAFT_337692 [Nemania serpens]|nr:hypothetical protein F5X97DRAFT_337692 [Nemania serpens]
MCSLEGARSTVIASGMEKDGEKGGHVASRRHRRRRRRRERQSAAGTAATCGTLLCGREADARRRHRLTRASVTCMCAREPPSARILERIILARVPKARVSARGSRLRLRDGGDASRLLAVHPSSVEYGVSPYRHAVDVAGDTAAQLVSKTMRVEPYFYIFLARQWPALGPCP